MIYRIDNQIEETDYRETDNSVIYVGIVSLEELETQYQALQFADITVDACRNKSLAKQSFVSAYPEYSFGIIHVIDGKNIQGERDRIGFYIKRNLLLIVNIFDRDQSTVKALGQMLEGLDRSRLTIEKLVYYFLNRLISEDNRFVEEVELKISKLEKKVMLKQVEGFNDKIFSIRRQLSILHNYYEQLIDIGEDLQENSNEIFDDEQFRYIGMFTNRASRLSGNIQMLREYISQVWEVHQAELDYNLNKTMQMFTVVTTIFLPLSLIAGWYGMNFKNMPELNWKYGYASVFIISILVVILCIYWFKKKKFF